MNPNNRKISKIQIPSLKFNSINELATMLINGLMLNADNKIHDEILPLKFSSTPVIIIVTLNDFNSPELNPNKNMLTHNVIKLFMHINITVINVNKIAYLTIL